MGVRGTLVASIVAGGRLWGLLSCHHDEPRVPDGPTRVLALSLAAAIATLVQANEQRQRELGGQWAQALLATLRSRVVSAADLSESIVAPDARFLEVVAADGLAVSTPAGLRTRGRLPPLASVTRLVDWLDEHVEVFFVSNHIGADVPELAPDPLAAGVMALRIPGFRRGWVIWSRTESQRTVGQLRALDLVPAAEFQLLQPLAQHFLSRPKRHGGLCEGAPHDGGVPEAALGGRAAGGGGCRFGVTGRR